MEIILWKIVLFTIQPMSLIYCKNPLIIIHIFGCFLFVNLKPGKVVVVARKPVGNYEGLYCKVACHPPQEKKKGFKCREVVKVIPQKKKLPMNFFESLPECSPPSIFSKKKTIKMIGHHSRLRDMMGQSYPIYACTRANDAHYSSVHVKFCSSSRHTC